MRVNNILRSRNSRILLWLLFAAASLGVLFLLLAPINITTREEAEQNADVARRREAEFVRMNSGVKRVFDDESEQSSQHSRKLTALEQVSRTNEKHVANEISSAAEKMSPDELRQKFGAPLNVDDGFEIKRAFPDSDEVWTYSVGRGTAVFIVTKDRKILRSKIGVHLH